MNTQPAPSQVVYVSFSAEINANTTESLIATMANIANDGVPEVYLLLSTPGGGVMNGINLYNVLRSFAFTLTTHNVGNVDSIGNAVFLAGEHRFACPHSTFMFHGVSVGFDGGGQRYEAKALQEKLAGVLADQKRIASIIEEHSSLNAKKIETLFRGAQTKDAAYAVDVGLVHEIKDVQIPPGARIIPLVF